MEHDVQLPLRKQAHSVDNVAEIIGTGRDGIYAAIRSGQLRARKFGRRTLILEHDLRAFLESLPELDLKGNQA